MNLSILDLFAGWGVSFMLVLTRLSAMIYTFPFFGSPAVSGRVRVLVALVFSFMVLPLVGIENLGTTWGLGDVTLAVGRELIIGLMVGFGAKFLFEAFNLAGTFAGRQMGFAMSDLVDPISSSPQSMVGQFWALAAILLFIVADGHHYLVGLMINHFHIVPLGQGAPKPATGQLLIAGSNNMFTTALKLGAPALILTMMIDIGVGIMARAMPRFQIFFVALPLKLLVGIFSLVVSLQLFQAMFSNMMEDFKEFLMNLTGSMG